MRCILTNDSVARKLDISRQFFTASVSAPLTAVKDGSRNRKTQRLPGDKDGSDAKINFVIKKHNMISIERGHRPTRVYASLSGEQKLLYYVSDHLQLTV